MQYLTHYRRAGAYRVGRTWRPHSLFRPTLPFSELTWLTNYCLSVLLVHLTDSAMLRHCASCKSTYYTRKIARQLRTQCRGHLWYTVTLKSRLTVNQGHWKRNHWVDHTRLTISRVIWRWILSGPWNVGRRSLKVIEISAIRKLGCGFLFAFYSNWPFL